MLTTGRGKRLLQPELMDDPHLGRQRHFHALRGLERINGWSGSARILWRPIAALARQRKQPLRVLDIATGAGDIPIALWQRAVRRGFRLEIDAWDRSADAIDFASARAAARGAAVRFEQVDALLGKSTVSYDIVISSLFLHHLSTDDALVLLQRMAEMAQSLVLINDLRRCAAGYVLAWCGTQVLSRSHIVHVDGPRSVQAAFTIPEVRDLASQAGLVGAHVRPCWPCRFLLSWEARIDFSDAKHS